MLVEIDILLMVACCMILQLNELYHQLINHHLSFHNCQCFLIENGNFLHCVL